MTVVLAVVTLVAAQRMAELVLAWRNTRRLMARGAVEVGRGHYPLLVVLHAGWLAAIVVSVPPAALPHPVLLGGLMAAMAARVWVMTSLGPFWTTRIITLPGVPLVRRGPYRWLRHPNYVVVAGEIALLPLAFGAWQVAVVFSALNGAVLAHRIAVEDAALTARAGGAEFTSRGSSAASG